MEKVKSFILKNKIELVVLLIAFLFSWWLMFSTFSYSNNEIQIASKAWSDFGSHIPLIRSFSFGDNFPPQYPLFSGPPIKYHFLFYAFVGLLEKVGFPLDFALNLPSIFGFAALIFMIYVFAKNIFKSRAVGILSILFFIFNGSLEFLKFFSQHPLSTQTLSQIINNKDFVSFGPYDGSIISAFWNLNIYTNQRHLGLSYALSLFIIYVFLKLKENRKENIKISIFIGVILGISFILNMAVFLMTVIVLLTLLVLLKNKKLFIFISLAIAAIISFPMYLFMQSGHSPSNIMLYTGYLVTDPTLYNFINYWFQNLGLHLLLIPLGFILTNKTNRKIFISFVIIFAIGNLVKFSPEIAANHKFFNYFLIVGGMFSAYFLVSMWHKKNFLKPFVVVAIFFLIISGVLDIFPILNDNKLTIDDAPKNKDVAWIIKNTKPNSIFLNTQYIYDNASLAGRKIFLGWPYFAWSQGYDTLTRDNLRKSLFKTSDIKFFCKNVNANNIDYADVSPFSDNIIINKEFLDKNFPQIYSNQNTHFFIYNVRDRCL